MKITIYLLVLSALLTACNGVQVSKRLDHVDSLVARGQYDSASVILNELNDASMMAEDRAHYNLLTTQLAYITNNPFPSDSLLDLAITYYNNVGNHKKLADAYVYKSYRSRIDQDYPQAVKFGKEAERLAVNTNDDRLKYKIADNLSYLNGLCENDMLQLQYAKTALAKALNVKNNTWILYSYNKISYAFYNLGLQDSAYIYIEKSIPYVEYVYDADKAAYYTNVGLLYKESNSEKAKEYFEKALDYGELPETIEHLADICYSEGNKEKAYNLWKDALTKDSRYKKDNLIHSILAYDLERGNLDEASKNLDDIIAIKDSMLHLLRNDTIKDLQLRFDHEVAMHEVDKKLINAQWVLLGLVLVVGILAFYIYIRRKKEEALQREYQMQLYAYTTEINELKANRDDAKNDAKAAIEKLNKKIKDLLDDKSPKLKQGRMLYDHIMGGGTTVNWSNKEEMLFNYYYEATNYQSYNRLRKVERTTNLSAHSMFYLILKDMGMKDDEIRRIMVLSPEGLRTLRHRTKPKE